MVEILELQRRFVIGQHLQSINVVSVVKHDIVRNSIISIDEVLISFHFHY